MDPDTFRLTGAWPNIQLAGWILLERGYAPEHILYRQRNEAALFIPGTRCDRNKIQLFAYRQQLAFAWITYPGTKFVQPFTYSHISHIPGYTLLPHHISCDLSHHTPRYFTGKQSVVVDSEDHAVMAWAHTYHIDVIQHPLAKATVLYLPLSYGGRKLLRHYGFYVRTAGYAYERQ